MSDQKITIQDLSGGLNNRDPAHGIALNEASKLENYLTDEGVLARKRLGQDLIQYAPIDPVAFDPDVAGTKSLWHLEGSGFNYTDEKAAATMNIVHGTSTEVTGLFDNGQRLTVASGADDGSQMKGGAVGDLGTPDIIQFDWWGTIDAGFSGKPIDVVRDSTTYQVSNDGCILISRLTSATIGAVTNGLTMHRDWDDVSGKHASDPYVKFRIQTNGIPGTVTEIVTKFLPTGRWLHIKATYNSITGVMRIEVNATVHNTASPNGGGTLDDSDSSQYAIGGIELFQTVASFLCATFAGVFDEVRISTVDHLTFPFLEPRGEPFPFELSTGEEYLVAAAGTALWYTTGNSEWTELASTDIETGGALDGVVDWDAVNAGDRLYLSNGINYPIAWNGSKVVSWMNPHKPPNAVQTASGSTNTDGVHRYAYTYKYGDDETGLSPYSSVPVSGNKDVSVYGIPTRHSNCTAICFYKTKAGETTPYYKIREIDHDSTLDTQKIEGLYAPDGPDIVDDTGADGVVDSVLSTINFKQARARVLATFTRKHKYLVSIHSRIFGSGVDDLPYTVFPSATGNPDIFFVANQIKVQSDKGRIVGMAPDNGEIIISKNGRATSAIYGSDPSSWGIAENIHSTVGAVGHRAFVSRISETEGRPSILCFWAPDGLYRVRGHVIKRVSDKIQQTVKSLTTYQASKDEFLQTTPTDFQSAANNGGSADQNIQETQYSVDGLRRTPGAVRIVDQLDYIGLWDGSAAGKPAAIDGKVLAIEKGAAEGEFYFSQDSDSKLYHTLDNFATIEAGFVMNIADMVKGTSDDRIIEIVRKGTTAEYFLFTDKDDGSGGSGGGYIFKWDGAVGTPVETSTLLFYEADTLQQYASESNTFLLSPGVLSDGEIPSANITGLITKSFHYFGNFQSDPFRSNLYLNHPQKISVTLSNILGAFGVLSASSRTEVVNNTTGAAYNSGLTGTLATGFYLVRDSAKAVPQSKVLPLEYAHPSSNGFTTQFTHRELAMWQGGTVRPQAFWVDGAGAGNTGALFFTASGVEDDNGNRTTHVYSKEEAVAIASVGSYASGVSLTNDGANGYFVASNPDTVGNFGFRNYFHSFLLTAPGSAASGVTTHPQFRGNFDVLRLSYNPNGGKLLAGGKDYNITTRNGFQFSGKIGSLEGVSGAFTPLKDFKENDNLGSFPIEMAYQTTTPFKSYVAVENSDTVVDEAAFYAVSPAMAIDSDVSPYKVPVYVGGQGLSIGFYGKMIFVPESGPSGGNLWSDRLYVPVTKDNDADRTADDAVPIQLGIPGDWDVIGEFVSAARNLGAFTAFGALVSDYSGEVDFFVRNASTATGTALFDSEQPQQNGVKIAGFNPVTSFVQWRTVLTWSHRTTTPAATPGSPTVNSVALEFFLGNPNIPEVTSMHFEGRTYFAVAENGETENNLVIVYQKNEGFTIYKGWNIKGLALFRGWFVALQSFELVRLEYLKTDQGNRIDAVGKTGAIVGDVDKAIDDITANILTNERSAFPTSNGHVLVTPYQGETALTEAWALAIPFTDAEEPRQVYLVPVGDFDWGWARVFILEFKTSDQVAGGTHVAAVDQGEVIQQIDVELVMEDTGRESSVK